MKVMIVKEVMTGDVSPMAMFKSKKADDQHWIIWLIGISPDQSPLIWQKLRSKKLDYNRFATLEISGNPALWF